MQTKEKVAILSSLAIIALLSFTTVAYATSTTYTTNQTVEQTNWRAAAAPLGTISFNGDDSGAYAYVATGNALHETFSYSPLVTNLVGADHVYTYHAGIYTLHSGVVSYFYAGFTFYNVWNGSLSFGGSSTPSDGATGQLNQWVFVYSSTDPFPGNDMNMGSGYWLTGFSTYVYGTPLSAPFASVPFFALALDPPHLP